MPIWLYILLRPRTTVVVRLAAIVMVLASTYLILRTASRGGMIALVIGCIVFFVQATSRQRLVAALLIPLCAVGAIALLPRQTLNRLTSFSSTEATDNDEAVQSRNTREYLVRRSLEFTREHPVFGVGVGQFSSYEGHVSTQSGQRGSWHVTHNTYTQVSSECGIPALLFFLGAIFVTFRTLHRTKRRALAAGHQDIATAAKCLIMGFASFCTAVIFLSLAYTLYFPLMTGIALAMQFAADRELKARSRDAVAPQRYIPVAGVVMNRAALRHPQPAV
jgi:O-antigen ligase